MFIGKNIKSKLRPISKSLITSDKKGLPNAYLSPSTDRKIRVVDIAVFQIFPMRLRGKNYISKVNNELI